MRGKNRGVIEKFEMGYRKAKKAEREKVCEKCIYRQIIFYQKTYKIWAGTKIIKASDTGIKKINNRCILMMDNFFPDNVITENYRLGKNYTCDKFEPAEEDEE